MQFILISYMLSRSNFLIFLLPPVHNLLEKLSLIPLPSNAGSAIMNITAENQREQHTRTAAWDFYLCVTCLHVSWLLLCSNHRQLLMVGGDTKKPRRGT